MPNVEAIVPTFFVQDLRASVEWYVRVLGFRAEFQTDDYAGVALGPVTIHLAQRAPSARTDVRYKAGAYLRLTSGLDEYVAEVESRGQALTAKLKDHPEYGMREATVRDPDGNDIYIGQALK